MKITWKQIDSFVKAPDPAARAILVYGPDDGLMRERAKAMALSIVSDINDPFNVAVLSTAMIVEDPARLSDEAGAISMMGGNRLIRIEDAGDKVTPFLKSYLEAPNDNAVIILEAGDLGPRSSLRQLCEKSKNAAALPCYVEDERDLARLIRETLQTENMSIEPDAVGWLSMNVAGDRRKVRGELEKLIIFKGEPGQVTLDNVRQACGEAGAQGLDELVYSVGGHKPGQAIKVYNQLLQEGVPFMAVLRALQNHFRRLHITKARIEQGTPLEEALKSLIPQVFFKQAPAFKSQVQTWNLKTLESILERLTDVEAQCKQTGMPVETLCGQTVLGIASIRN